MHSVNDTKYKFQNHQQSKNLKNHQQINQLFRHALITPRCTHIPLIRITYQNGTE